MVAKPPGMATGVVRAKVVTFFGAVSCLPGRPRLLHGCEDTSR